MNFFDTKYSPNVERIGTGELPADSDEVLEDQQSIIATPMSLTSLTTTPAHQTAIPLNVDDIEDFANAITQKGSTNIDGIGTSMGDDDL